MHQPHSAKVFPNKKHLRWWQPGVRRTLWKWPDWRLVFFDAASIPWFTWSAFGLLVAEESSHRVSGWWGWLLWLSRRRLYRHCWSGLPNGESFGHSLQAHWASREFSFSWFEWCPFLHHPALTSSWWQWAPGFLSWRPRASCSSTPQDRCYHHGRLQNLVYPQKYWNSFCCCITKINFILPAILILFLLEFQRKRCVTCRFFRGL